jgi:zinc transporter ZupT
MPAMGPALAIAVFLHKVPEAATLLTVLRRGRVGRRQGRAAFAFYVAATPLGMVAAGQLLRILSHHGVALLLAFVAGSLLHLVTGHLLPEATEHDADGEHRWTYAIMLGGFLMLLAARLLGGG